MVDTPPWPIAKITVKDGMAARTGLYAPGLPDGDHDVYCTPWEGWQPIETAPTDRQHMLLWFPQLGYPVVGWPEAYGYTTGGWKATHWMPLPAAPLQPTCSTTGESNG